MAQSSIRLDFLARKNIAIYILLTVSIVNTCNYGAPLNYVAIPFIVSFIFLVLPLKNLMNLRKAAVPTIINFISVVVSTILSGRFDSLMTTTISFACFSALLILIVQTKYDSRDFIYILNFYTFIGVILCILVILRCFQGSSTRITSVFGIAKDRNFYSAFVLPCFAYSLYRVFFSPQKGLFIIVSIIITIATILTGSRASFLVMLCIFVFLMIAFIKAERLGIKKILMLLSIFISMCVVFYYVSSSPMFIRITNMENYTDDVRLKLWSIAFDEFLKHPIFGGGRGATNSATVLIEGHVAHNTFLEILGDQGIIGGFCFLWNIKYILKNGKKGRTFLIAFLIACFLPKLFISDYSTCGFWLMLALNITFVRNECSLDIY